jgi:hypothetical protein
MMRSIPSISKECLDAHFDIIDSKLAFYENLIEAAPLSLELAIWKSKIIKRFGPNHHVTAEMKIQCRTDSITMVAIIVSNVLSFL